MTGTCRTCSCSITVPTPDKAARIPSSAIASCKLDSFFSASLNNRLGLMDGPLLPGGLGGVGPDPFPAEADMAASSGASFEQRTDTCLVTARR